ncbi:MAG: hypothetical protein QOK40_3118 [Miltoncostaeaceae bacterium]|nr:hypothetical protein [Miltoncostaeaceae bacterium]
MQRTSVLLISVAFGVATLFAGLVGLTQRSNRFHAEARVVVAPVATTNPGDVVGQLGQGVVTSTFAQAFAGNAVVRPALGTAGFSADDIGRVNITSQVLAGTSVVEIDAASKDPVLAERAADAVAAAKPALGGLNKSFETTVLSKATGTAKRSGASNGALVLVAIIAAIIAGLLAATVLRRIPPRQPSSGEDRPPEAESTVTPPVASPR